MCGAITSVDQCALRARSTHGVHHAIVEVNIVIGVVLGELHVVVRVHIPLVVVCDEAVVRRTLGLIALVVIVVFVVAIFNKIFLYGRYTLYIQGLEVKQRPHRKPAQMSKPTEVSTQTKGDEPGQPTSLAKLRKRLPMNWHSSRIRTPSENSTPSAFVFWAPPSHAEGGGPSDAHTKLKSPSGKPQIYSSHSLLPANEG